MSDKLTRREAKENLSKAAYLDYRRRSIDSDDEYYGYEEWKNRKTKGTMFFDRPNVKVKSRDVGTPEGYDKAKAYSRLRNK